MEEGDSNPNKMEIERTQTIQIPALGMTKKDRQGSGIFRLSHLMKSKDGDLLTEETTVIQEDKKRQSIEKARSDPDLSSSSKIIGNSLITNNFFLGTHSSEKELKITHGLSSDSIKHERHVVIKTPTSFYSAKKGMQFFGQVFELFFFLDDLEGSSILLVKILVNDLMNHFQRTLKDHLSSVQTT